MTNTGIVRYIMSIVNKRFTIIDLTHEFLVLTTIFPVLFSITFYASIILCINNRYIMYICIGLQIHFSIRFFFLLKIILLHYVIITWFIYVIKLGYMFSNNSLSEHFHDKSVLILGAGITGTASLDFLQDMANNVQLIDDNQEKLDSICSQYGKDAVLHSNSVTRDILNTFDYILISPGIPINHKLYQYAVARNIVITDLDLFFWHHLQSFFIGVTGTDGKSTL